MSSNIQNTDSVLLVVADYVTFPEAVPLNMISEVKIEVKLHVEVDPHKRLRLNAHVEIHS